jgi:glyoxylase-like metal-dependent hydrolase (beta-lactamase superfamily II)
MSIHIGKRSIFLIFAVLLALAGFTFSQEPDFSKIPIATEKLGDSIYMLTGAGGNIGVSVGVDGILIIDSQFPQVHDKIAAALAAISSGPVRYLFNTNWHYDHVSGNELFAKKGAVIVSHETARERMDKEQIHKDLDITIPPYPASALPVLTIADSLTLYFNNEVLQVLHIPNAHSDADLLFRFQKANVIHSGDLLFSTMYPYIDVPHGGSINGMIAAADEILRMCDADTRLIPGHGPAMKRDDVTAFRDMLVLVRDRVAVLIKEGKSDKEILAAKPTADLDALWQKGIPAELLVQLVYDSLKEQ